MAKLGILRKIFITLYFSLALAITVVEARAIQTQREFEQLESRQLIQDEKLTTDYQRINDLERRVDELTRERVLDRITRLEALSETTHELLIAIATAMAILVIETAIRLVGGIKPYPKRREDITRIERAKSLNG